jgi:hypothetical protein
MPDGACFLRYERGLWAGRYNPVLSDVFGGGIVQLVKEVPGGDVQGLCG